MLFYCSVCGHFPHPRYHDGGGLKRLPGSPANSPQSITQSLPTRCRLCVRSTEYAQYTGRIAIVDGRVNSTKIEQESQLLPDHELHQTPDFFQPRVDVE